jgi:hypothetical protein
MVKNEHDRPALVATHEGDPGGGGLGATAGGWSKMSDEPLARERGPIERVRARLEALVMANAAPRCGARSKRTGKPCRAAAMPNGRCKVHGGKSTGPRAPEGLERSRRANGKRLLLSRSEGGTVARADPRPDTAHTGPFISVASMPMARSLPRARG